MSTIRGDGWIGNSGLGRSRYYPKGEYSKQIHDLDVEIKRLQLERTLLRQAHQRIPIPFPPWVIRQ